MNTKKQFAQGNSRKYNKITSNKPFKRLGKYRLRIHKKLYKKAKCNTLKLKEKKQASFDEKLAMY